MAGGSEIMASCGWLCMGKPNGNMKKLCINLP